MMLHLAIYTVLFYWTDNKQQQNECIEYLCVQIITSLTISKSSNQQTMFILIIKVRNFVYGTYV